MWSKYDRGTGNGNSIGLFLIEIQATKWRKSHLSSTIAPVGDPTLPEKEKLWTAPTLVV
jgi:hypothetical protein